MSDSPSPERLCIHTATTKPLFLERAISAYAAAGVRGMAVWRDAIVKRDPVTAGNAIRSAGMEVTSLCRGGFFVSPDSSERRAAIDENKSAIREASALGAPVLVLVCGAHEAVRLGQARDHIREGIEAVLPLAEELQVNLAIEPLHPMYASDRSAINTMESANIMCDMIDHSRLGIAVDVYHVWWDPGLERQLMRSGERIFAFHICDWLVPTRDMLNDRGVMGQGCIPIRAIRALVERAGFSGFNEVEIFSNKNWALDQEKYVGEIAAAYFAYG